MPFDSDPYQDGKLATTALSDATANDVTLKLDNEQIAADAFSGAYTLNGGGEKTLSRPLEKQIFFESHESGHVRPISEDGTRFGIECDNVPVLLQDLNDPTVGSLLERQIYIDTNDNKLKFRLENQIFPVPPLINGYQLNMPSGAFGSFPSAGGSWTTGQFPFTVECVLLYSALPAAAITYISRSVVTSSIYGINTTTNQPFHAGAISGSNNSPVALTAGKLYALGLTVSAAGTVSFYTKEFGRR